MRKCKLCGRPLKLVQWPEIYEGRTGADGLPARYGYRGCNVFCTQSCGYRFAVAAIRAGLVTS